MCVQNNLLDFVIYHLLPQTTDGVKPGQLSCFLSLERIARQLFLLLLNHTCIAVVLC